MRAELVLMGKRIDMAPRAHRRLLVLLIYFILTALMVFSWSLSSGAVRVYSSFLLLCW